MSKKRHTEVYVRPDKIEEHIDQHLDRMERDGIRRSGLDLWYSTGFGFIGMGIGLLPAGLSLASQKLPYGTGMAYGGAILLASGVMLLLTSLGCRRREQDH
jgi:hypothetical protein